MEFIYSPQTLSPGTSSTKNQTGWIDQAFGPGKYTNKDWSDTKLAAYNYLLKQQDNALQVDLMNYMNKYNSPQNQMLLRQAAGINPYSDYSVQGAANANVTAPHEFSSSGTYAKKQQAQAAKINAFLNTLETGSKIYDYMKYGRDLSKYQLDAAVGRSGIVSEQLQQEVMRTGMLAWELGYPGYEQVGSSPYGTRYGLQTQGLEVSQEVQRARKNAYVKQINYLVDQLYPSQKERNEALKQLDDQRYGIEEGRYGAVTSIHTGNSTADGILQFLLMALRDMMRFGFSGKLF